MNELKKKEKKQDAKIAMKKHLKVIRKVPKNNQKRRNNTDSNKIPSKYLTFKDLVKFCHIKEPKNRIQTILGAKYPLTEQEFETSNRFEGKFDPT
jgi:hypothetical protein